MNIATRFAVVSGILVVFSAFTIGAILFGTNGEILLNRAKSELGNDVDHAGRTFLESIDLARGEVRFLASIPQVQALADGDAGVVREEELIPELVEIFYALAQSSSDLLQVRFIGAADNGRELVRVDRQANLVRRVPVSELQQKGERDYVKATLAAAPGAILMTRIELNREFGELQTPHVAVLRVSTPVYSRDGQVFGLIIINLNMSAIFDRMRAHIRNAASFYVANGDGDFVVHPDPTKAFAFEFGEHYRLIDDFPALEPFVDSAYQMQSQMMDVGPQGRQVVSVSRIELKATLSREVFITVVSLPTVAIFGDGMDEELAIGGLTLLLAVVGAIAAVVTSNRLVGPLQSLSRAAVRFAKGDRVDKLALPVQREDEIGSLARSFAIMAHTLEDRQTKLEEKEERIGAILEAAGTPIVTIDKRGVVMSANPATTRLFGYEREELLGRNISVLMNPHDREHHDDYLKKYQQTGEARIVGVGREVQARHKDGSAIPIHLSVSALTLRNGLVYTGVMTDLREQKKIARLKDEFVSTVSHELRTPLTSIKGALALLKVSMFGTLPQSAAQMIDIAHANSERLARLVDDILDMEKIEAGKLSFSFERVALRDFLDDMVQANSGFAHASNVKLSLGHCPAQLAVDADPDRLAQIVTNLVSNAIKFTPSGGEVTVSARSKKGRVEMLVSDQGPGIPVDFVDKLFTKFAQADASTTRTQGGSGLGLAITKAIVLAHGGKIDFHPNPDIGTTFRVELPTRQSDAVADGLKSDKQQIAGAA